MWPTLQPGDQVTVEPVTIGDLQPGDWVLLQGREGLFLHRLLGFTREGALLTKGDGHRAPDAPWPPEALRGRAVAISRQGKTIPVSSSSLRQRVQTTMHRLMAAAWSLARRVGFLALLLVVTPAIARAAVVLISFEATPVGQSVYVTWVTASEVDMLGFDLQRATAPDAEYQSIVFVWAEGDIVGASYAHTDTDVKYGQTYYYRLKAIENDEDSEFHGPISVTVPFPVTSTPTPTPTPTRRAPPPPPPVTASPSPTPTPTPTPPTGTPPTPTPTRTPTRTPAGTGSADNTPTQTPTPTPPKASTAGPSLATVAATSAAGLASSDATTTPPASQPTGSPPSVPIAGATISPTAGGRPNPSPSPFPTAPSSSHTTTSEKGTSWPWGLILVLVLLGCGLLALGGWGYWRTRDKK
jgi:hypothetical protein